MTARILRRLAQMIFVVWGAATLTFFLLRLAAGDPARLMEQPGTPESVIEHVRHELGTDKPLLIQYRNYLVDLLHGNLGYSFHAAVSVKSAVLQALPNTLELAAVTIVVSSVVALTLGILAALRVNGATDRAILVYVSLAQATPNFWLGVVLVLFFSVRHSWFPAVGKEGPSSFVLPVATLAITLTPVLIRTVRQSLLEALSEDHVRAARARGLPERRVLLIHGLKVASLPLVTLIALQMATIIAGSYVVEYIFDWPGLGKLTLDSVASRDFPMIQGCVLVAATVFVVVNFLTDMAYTLLDPRVRHGDL
jgi:ABC-type dipeptide/oligopeptide/nickel transport system permease component